MNVQQLYTNCLAQGAYYVSHNGQAAIIDPLRETQPYLDLLKKNNDTLKYIFETHFHADFVSGHVDLAEATGAQIVFGPQAQTDYKSYFAKDEEEFTLGDLTIRVLHTPGHTPESSTYLLLDEHKKPCCIFTGDTLFIGDVGRPDLAIKSDVTQEDLAGMLYDSLRKKIMPLPDDVIVYPAHGAGSACGKNMSKETFDTLGNQKKTNYALQDISRASFITQLTTDILPAPQYFAKNAFLNKKGYKKFGEVLLSGSKALNAEDFEQLIKKEQPIVLDVRSAEEFAKARIPNALFIGLDGQFAPWVGTLIGDIEAAIVLVTPEGKEEEAVMRLSRVGYDNCLGHLAGGINTWINAGKKTEAVKTISAEIFIDMLGTDLNIIDVRKPSEFAAGHLKNVDSNPLDFIYDWADKMDLTKPYLLHCAGGYRSMIALSILKMKGFIDVTSVNGGYGAFSKLDKVKDKLVAEEQKV
jgi:glyoxylase-like metal-dependent hydrolase (beta-lactamase superfamily II)/rhodanese-related sulfurtransferase